MEKRAESGNVRTLPNVIQARPSDQRSLLAESLVTGYRFYPLADHDASLSIKSGNTTKLRETAGLSVIVRHIPGRAAFTFRHRQYPADRPTGFRTQRYL